MLLVLVDCGKLPGTNTSVFLDVLGVYNTSALILILNFCIACWDQLTLRVVLALWATSLRVSISILFGVSRPYMKSEDFLRSTGLCVLTSVDVSAVLWATLPDSQVGVAL